MTIDKTCSCGAHYTAAGWLRLPLLGSMEDGEDGRLSLRNCDNCDSTIAADVRADLFALSTLITELRSRKRPVEWAAGDLSGTEDEAILAQAKPAQNAALLAKALEDWFELTHRSVVDRCSIHGDAVILSCDECVAVASRCDPNVRRHAASARASARRTMAAQ